MRVMEYPDPRNSYRPPSSRCSYHRSNSFDAVGDAAVGYSANSGYGGGGGYHRTSSNPYMAPSESGYSDNSYAYSNGYAHSDYSSDYGSDYAYSGSDYDYSSPYR